MKKIILTGGGTAGPVTPDLALLPDLKARGFEVLYVGSYGGIERKLIEKEGVPYRGISSGKLRRYFSLQNFTDPFRVMKGFLEAMKIVREFKPDVVFSKDKLFDHVWGMDAIGDVSTVTVHIKHIRDKIEAGMEPVQYIETVWGVGYRFRG